MDELLEALAAIH